MLKDITGKLNKYQPCFKRIDFEAILKDMDTRIDGDNSIADKAVTLAKLADTVQASVALADSAIQTVPQATVIAAIAVPGSATAADCANKINAVIAALKVAGLMATV